MHTKENVAVVHPLLSMTRSGRHRQKTVISDDLSLDKILTVMVLFIIICKPIEESNKKYEFVETTHCTVKRNL